MTIIKILIIIRQMKKYSIIFILCMFFVGTNALFAQEGKTSFTAGITPLEKEDDALQFGGAYILFDTLMNTDFASIGAKIL